MPGACKAACHTMTIRSFGKWPAITENQFGSGSLLYEGTYLSDALQTAVLRRAVEEAGLSNSDQQLPPAVHVQHGVNRMGKHIHYYFNYSSSDVKAAYSYGAGTKICSMARRLLMGRI